ncbi:MAG TPA: hypothetical protein VIL74_20570 [Pyrinomonadaceae bacterium]|jgi:hypothetical protein
MTLSVFGAHKDGAILAADGRLTVRVLDPTISARHSTYVFVDGYQKIFTLDSPHDFFGVAFYGASPIPHLDLMQQLKSKLPDKRLKTVEYAQNLYKLYREIYFSSKAAKAPHNPAVIYVAGIDLKEPFGKLYMFCPEEGVVPNEVSGGKTILRSGGETSHLNSAATRFYKDYLDRLSTKKTSLRKIGMNLNSRELEIAKKVLSKLDPVELLNFAEFTDLAAALIKNTAKEQLRLNELPTVGNDVDLVTITPKTGISINSETGESRFAETDKNHISITCCNKEYRIQLLFSEEDPINEDFIPLSADASFTCDECKKTYNFTGLLGNLKQVLEDILN